MNNGKNTDNEKILITEEMIPIVYDNGEPKTIRIVVDEHPARCFLRDRGWNSTKIVILFDNPHPVWNEFFTTKHFDFIEPGKMHWGYNEEVMKISKED
mgnify:FL=1